MLESGSISMWTLFTVFVVGALILDLGILNRKSHAPSFREALYWSAGWIVLAMIFCCGLYYKFGEESGISFLAGYLVELSLSVDNLFVFIMVFEFFKLPQKYQHRVLFWGIIGAVILRAAFIFLGLEIIQHFEWVLYLMGIFLVLVGTKMALKKTEQQEDFGKSKTVRLLKKIIPLSDSSKSDSFFVKEHGQWLGTPLLLVLLAIDVVDVIFAVDSIPAVIAVTQDPFVVFTSNIFAILGLRSMYFLISGVMTVFRFLQFGVSLILIFVGIKMLTAKFFHVPISATLAVMISLLGASIILSILLPRK